MPGRWAGSGEVVLGSGSLESSRVRHGLSCLVPLLSLGNVRLQSDKVNCLQTSKPRVLCMLTTTKWAKDGLGLSDDSAEGYTCCFHGAPGRGPVG